MASNVTIQPSRSVEGWNHPAVVLQLRINRNQRFPCNAAPLPSCPWACSPAAWPRRPDRNKREALNFTALDAGLDEVAARLEACDAGAAQAALDVYHAMAERMVANYPRGAGPIGR